MPASNTQTVLTPNFTNAASPKPLGLLDLFRNEDDFVEFSSLEVVSEPDKEEFGFWLSIAVEIKRGGVWRIHKNDPDKHFPSDFHADRVDKPEKLDLYTGAIYSKKHGQHLRSMSRKDMCRIHSELKACGRDFLDAKLASADKFTYLN